MNDNLELLAPKLSKADIRAIASPLIDAYETSQPEAVKKLNGIEFGHFYEAVIKPRYGIEIIEDYELTPSIEGIPRLGTYNIPKNYAVIALQRPDPRRDWTLYHEVIGHGLLHGPYFRRKFNELLINTEIDVTEVSISKAAIGELEKQANYLASLISAPLKYVKLHVIRTFGLHVSLRPIHFAGPGEYSLEVNGRSIKYDVGSYHDLCVIVAKKIRPYFGGLSFESLAYRVSETGLVANQSQNPYIGHYKNNEIRGLELDRLAM